MTMANSIGVEAGALVEWTQSAHWYEGLYDEDLQTVVGTAEKDYVNADLGTPQITLDQVDDLLNGFFDQEHKWLRKEKFKSDYIDEIKVIDRWWGRAFALVQVYALVKADRIYDAWSAAEAFDDAPGWRKAAWCSLAKLLNVDDKKKTYEMGRNGPDLIKRLTRSEDTK
jgi:hypothetical protein